MVSCDIHGNGASILAGFLYIQLEAYKSRIVIDSCNFVNNYTENGGASVFQESTFSTKELYLTICNSEFRNNFVDGGQGTGMDLIMPELALALPGQIIRDTIILIKNYFESNDMFSTVLSSENSFSSVVNNVFYDNKRLSFSSNGKDLIFENNILNSNLLRGSLFNPIRDIFFNGNLFINNKSADNVSFYSNLFSSAFNSFTDTIICVGNTFVNNEIARNPNVNSQGYLWIHNNLMVQNKSSIDTSSSIPFYHAINAEFSHNLSDVPCEDFFDPAVCGVGNIVTSDPGFRDPANGDFRLLPCSPAVNAGDNAIVSALGITIDLDGTPRIQDGQVDMGAYESPTLSVDAEAVVRAACISQNNGAVAFDLPSGCPPFDFAWSAPPASGADTVGLAPGLYTFTITDQKGKVMVQTLLLEEASPMATLSDVTPATCSVCADGSIVVSSVSGDAPFTFLWSNGAVGQSINDLMPGVYYLTLSDAWGCDTVLAFEVPFTIAAKEQTDDHAAPSVWPNPCRDVLFLDWQGASRWTLFAPDGKVARRINIASANRQSVDLILLPAGMYISVFESESGRIDRSSVVLVR